MNTPDNEGYCPENSRRARACLTILQSLGTVDMARVAAFGHSMGAFLTGGLLGEIPASFRAACISAGGTAVGYFQVTIQSSGSTTVNHRPDISWIADQRATPGAAIPPLAFTVTDAETAAAALTVTADSSNPTLVPVANIVFGGQNWGRTVTLTPAAGQAGRSVVTLSVSDGTYTTSTSFVLDVVTGNTPPAITALPTTHTTTLGGSPQPLAFAVNDAETAAPDLRLTASSSNTTLVTTGNIAFGGSGADRSMTITPTPGRTGAATITLAVSDGDIVRTAQLLYVVTDPAGAAAQFSRPRGVFILDSANAANHTTSFGTTISLRDGNIRNLPFVDGFTLRAAWSDMESHTTPGSYDFFIIENALNKLPAGQRLSLIIVPGEPAYIATTPGVDTWLEDTTLRAKPWDSYLRTRRKALLAAMSQHLVSGVPLGRHPRIDVIDPYLPGGFTGIRDPNSTPLRNIAGYTRQRFLEAVQDELRALQDKFPGKFVQLGFWPITDNENAAYSGVTASEWLRQQLLAEFDGVTRPRVGFFMENLAAKRSGPAIDPSSSTPVISFASALDASKNTTWNGFQMLGSWVRPFNDGHVNNTLNGTPNDAMEAAFNTYLTYTYTRRTDAPWLGYNVEVSEDLIEWKSGNAVTEQVGPPLPSGDGVSERITVRILPIPGSAARFVRLAVSNLF